MEIDSRIEPLVREALDAAVKKDPERLGTALEAFTDNSTRQRGFELAVAIGTVALFHAYDGAPTSADLEEAAKLISEMESWADLSSDEIHRHLSALANRESVDDGSEPERTILLMFVVTASLLSASPKKREGWTPRTGRLRAIARQ